MIITRRNKQKRNCSKSSFLYLVFIGFGISIGIAIGSSGTALFLYGEQHDTNPILDAYKQPSLQSQETGPSKTKQWDNWPSVAYEEVGHPLVTKGDSFFNQARDLYFQQQNGKTLMDEFIEVYKKRPDPVNMCGIRINHALALFLAVKHIQPSLVVESGVNAGVSTYFIRAASPTTKIFAIDPLDKPICGQGKRWIDPSEKTSNFTGENFVDLLALDWKGMVSRKEVDPDKTLVFIDDHLHAFKRIAGVMKFGVRHIVVEDNYKMNEGTCKLLSRMNLNETRIMSCQPVSPTITLIFHRTCRSNSQ
jgi:hypothetical protein